MAHQERNRSASPIKRAKNDEKGGITVGIGTMVREAIERSDTPAKAWAIECGVSVDALYSCCQEKRPIPRQARRKLSNMHLLAGLAVALEDTGYVCFEPLAGDRHPLALVEKVRQELHRLVDEIEILPPHLVDKLKAGDLALEDRELLEDVDREMIRLLRALFSFLIESQDQYEEPVTQMLAGKEKTA